MNYIYVTSPESRLLMCMSYFGAKIAHSCAPRVVSLDNTPKIIVRDHGERRRR
jgi:hypothetical protein